MKYLDLVNGVVKVKTTHSISLKAHVIDDATSVDRCKHYNLEKGVGNF